MGKASSGREKGDANFQPSNECAYFKINSSPFGLPFCVSLLGRSLYVFLGGDASVVFMSLSSP